MTSAPEVEYSPYQTHIDGWDVQVTDFSNVQYTQQHLSGDENENIKDQGKFFFPN